MSYLSSSAAAITPDRSRTSTLGSIWTSRHKAKPTLTSVEAARRRMDLQEIADADFACTAYREPRSFWYLALTLAAGCVVNCLLYVVIFHLWPAVTALIGGR